MRCPNCSSQMTARSVLTSDQTKRITNYLCSVCLKRILKTEPNTVMAIESKTIPRVITHNPHVMRGRIPVVRATGQVITRGAIDEAPDAAEESEP